MPFRIVIHKPGEFRAEVHAGIFAVPRQGEVLETGGSSMEDPDEKWIVDRVVWEFPESTQAYQTARIYLRKPEVPLGEVGSEAVQELEITNRLLEERSRPLYAIPPCPVHGEGCVPWALEWIEKAKHVLNES